MRQTLLRAAEIIACAEVYPAPIPEDEGTDFGPAIRAGQLKVADDHVSFVALEQLHTGLASYCARNISAVWQDLAAATWALRKADHLRVKFKLPKTFFATLFVSLEKEYGISVLPRLVEAARIKVRAHEANHVLNAIYFPFCDALPDLTFRPDELANQLGPVLKATESYLPAGLLHGAVERLASRSKEQADALVEAFLAQPEQGSAELAANALKALWAFAPIVAHKQAMRLTEATCPTLQRIGAISLAWFSYEFPMHDREFAATINRLEVLCESGDSEVLPVIIQAFGTLISSSGDSAKLLRVKEGFLRLASNKEPAVQSVAAHVLSRRPDDSENAEWFWDALGRLSSVPSGHKGTLDRLDLTTYSLVEHHPERVINHLEGVVTSRQYVEEGEKDRLPNLYENTVVRLIEKQLPMLEATITRWFASKDCRLHAAAADIVSRFVQEARQDPERTIRLESSTLNALDQHDVQRLICALLGYVGDFRALACLLISVLSRIEISGRDRKLIVDALADVALYNMPGSVGEYLRDVARDTNEPEHVHQVVTESLSRSNAYFTPLEGRANLKEFAPPDNRVHRFDVAHRQLMQALREKVLKESGLLSIIPTTRIKYGRSSFSSERGNAASSVPMRTIRSDIELPRELMIDPFGRRIKRINWRLLALEGLPTEPGRGSEKDFYGSNKETVT